jgi:hypothetical protein
MECLYSMNLEQVVQTATSPITKTLINGLRQQRLTQNTTKLKLGSTYNTVTRLTLVTRIEK